MTMPWLENCSHSDSGWCLECVKKLGDNNEELRTKLGISAVSSPYSCHSCSTSLYSESDKREGRCKDCFYKDNLTQLYHKINEIFDSVRPCKESFDRIATALENIARA